MASTPHIQQLLHMTVEQRPGKHTVSLGMLACPSEEGRPAGLGGDTIVSSPAR